MSDEEFNDYNIQLSDDEHIWLCSEGIEFCIILLIITNRFNALEIELKKCKLLKNCTYLQMH